MPCEAWWDCFFDMLVNALRYIKDVVVDTRAYASCGVCVWLYKVYEASTQSRFFGSVA